MIVTCPKCTTRYRVASTALSGAGRKARCTNCGHAWVVAVPLIEQALQREMQRRQAGTEPTSDQPQQPEAAGTAESPQDDEERASERQTEAEPRDAEPQSHDAGDAEPRDIEQADHEAAAPANPNPGAFEDVRDTVPQAVDEDVLEDDESIAAAPPWEHPASDEAREAEPEAERGPAASDGVDEPAGEGVPAGRRKWITFAALGGAILVVALVVGLVLARNTIETAFPGADRWYAMVGLQRAPGSGLSIGDVTSAREDTETGEALIVEGEVTNISEENRSLPNIRVTVFDADDEELQYVMVTPEQQELAPGERISFVARLDNPQPQARRIKVTFARGEGGAGDLAAEH